MVLLFGAETWVLSAPMAKKLEGVHVGFLRKVTRMKAKRLKDGSWRKVASDKVLQGAGTQLLQTYIDRSQETMVDWVALQPFFYLCARETGYDRGRNLQETWRIQASSEKQLRVTLEYILDASREKLQQESIRRDGGEGGEEGEVTNSGG